MLEQDFLAVYHDHRALRNIDSKLTSLFTIKNPNYPDIRMHERFIEYWKKRKKESWETEAFYEMYQSQKIGEIEKKIKELKKNDPVYREETQIIDQGLHEVLQRMRKGFRLYLNEEHYYYLIVEREGKNSLVLKFCSANASEIEQIKKSAIIRELQFSWNGDKTALIRSYQISDHNGILALKEVVSRLCFGLKDYLGTDQQIYLELY